MTPAERDAALLPPDALVAALPDLDLDAEGARRLTQGQTIERAGAPGAGLARVYGPGRRFLGLAEVTGNGPCRAAPPDVPAAAWTLSYCLKKRAVRE